jgi:CBS domain-containing protein
LQLAQRLRRTSGMSRTVEEIMNREVFALRPDESAEQALDCILLLGITGAPVTDRDRHVIGHASFRDLLGPRKGSLVGDRMTTPVEVVSPGTTIDEAGRRMARLGLHRLVVTEESRVVGVVSALDVVSALLGMPVVHPPAFPHFDPSTGTIWTDEAELTLDAIGTAPDGPGVFVLIEGAPLKRDWAVWTEATSNVRTRLYDLLSSPQEDAVLARLLEHPGKLRFRAALVTDEGERDRVLDALKEASARWPGSPFHCETEQTVARPASHADL